MCTPIFCMKCITVNPRVVPGVHNARGGVRIWVDAPCFDNLSDCSPAGAGVIEPAGVVHTVIICPVLFHTTPSSGITILLHLYLLRPATQWKWCKLIHDHRPLMLHVLLVFSYGSYRFEFI